MNKNILRISVLPLILFTAMTFTALQPDKQNDNKKNKGNKEQDHPASKGNKDKPQDNQNHSSKGNNNKPQNNKNHSSNGNDVRKNGNDHAKNNDHGNGNSGKSNKNVYKSNGNSKIMNGKRDIDIDWNFANFADRKHPKNQKKVNICHNPSGDRTNGVSINVSENALQAHMNHGDVMGNCDIDYSDRWSTNYVNSREQVYNNYEQAWETMSYSEALLKLAMEKLLGVRTDLNTRRTTLTTSDVQRREALILDLQNNVVSLENQLGATRQTLDSDVNILITL